MWPRLLPMLLLLSCLAPAMQAQERDERTAKVSRVPILYSDPYDTLQEPPDDLTLWGPIAALMLVVMGVILWGGPVLEEALWTWKWRRLEESARHGAPVRWSAMAVRADEMNTSSRAMPEEPWTPSRAMKLRSVTPPASTVRRAPDASAA